MKWFKIFGESWFIGSTRWELSIEQRAIFIDLLARASLNDPAGEISYFSLEQLGDQFRIPLELLENAICRCEEVGKVKHLPKKRKIVIVNWKKYQSEYDRQKVYRKQDRGLSNVTKEGDNPCNKVTLRREEDKEARED
jgi:hypothetical protein